ncbi:MAG: plastocyanin/azurin family copper-binding protein [Gemmatimonadota bacterium]|nr:plastocyanin/azurin family copper-binding protein [Gemmatimonadota bacterium]
MSTFKRRYFTLLPAVAVLGLASACGGGEEPAPDAGETAAPTAAPASPATAPTTGASTTGNVIEVVMTTTDAGASGTFEPATITARKGDVIRFVAEGGAAHNVSFPQADNPGKAGLPAPSPYITTAGQTWELPVTMNAGSYNFQCDPHAMMGMKGVLTVTE